MLGAGLSCISVLLDILLISQTSNLLTLFCTEYFVTHSDFISYRKHGPGDGRSEKLKDLVATVAHLHDESSSESDESDESDDESSIDSATLLARLKDGARASTEGTESNDSVEGFLNGQQAQGSRFFHFNWTTEQEQEIQRFTFDLGIDLV